MQPLSAKLPWDLANPKWAAALNPLLALPLVNGTMVSATLTATTPAPINHLLGRVPQGWLLLDNTANAVVWRTQPFNATTLTLEASATTTVNLWVF